MKGDAEDIGKKLLIVLDKILKPSAVTDNISLFYSIKKIKKESDLYRAAKDKHPEISQATLPWYSCYNDFVKVNL